MIKRTDEEVMEMAHKACEILQIDREIIFGRCRKSDHVFNRHVTLAALMDMGAYNSQISRVFNIDHATTIHAIKKINNHAKLYPEVRSKLHMLKIAFGIKI